MKAYLLTFFLAAIFSLMMGTGWYIFFGYDAHISIPENLVLIYSSLSFWYGLIVWTFLYWFFVGLPLLCLKNKAI